MRLCYVAWGNSIHTIRWLRWFARKGHEVHLITHQDRLFAPLENVTVHVMPPVASPRVRGLWRVYRRFPRAIQRLHYARHIRRLVAEIRPDVLHILNGAFPNYLALFTGFRPLCFTGWNGDIFKLDDVGWFYRACLRLLMRYAEVLCANSQRMADQFVQLGAYPSRVHYIQWGPDHALFHRRDGHVLRQHLGLTDEPIVLSSRSLSFQVYNNDVIVRAIPHVLQQIPRARFLFIWHAAGDLERMEQLIDELGVREAVILGGTVDPETLPDYYSIADVFVSVSSYDSCPQSMLEAMACGVAPVMGDIPAAREWITHGHNGYLVPCRDPQALAEAIVHLLQDQETRHRFVVRNLELVRQKADYDREMKRMEQLYLELIDRGRPTADRRP